MIRSLSRASLAKTLVWAFLISCFAASVAMAERPEATGTYGDGAGDGEAIAIARIVEQPEKFKGQEVKVEGEISGVCPKKGCWLELRDADDRSLRVKVKDDVIVFPVDAVGLKAVARGVVQIIDMDRDRYVGWMRHQAEEKGEAFDESSIGDGPYQIIQLAGVGAEIG